MTRLSALATVTATALLAERAHASTMGVGTITGVVTPYTIQSADIGSCRLKGVDSTSQNFKYYASVSSKDVTMNEGCGRCIKVTKDGAVSVTAFALDVCQGCKAGEVKLSKSALTDLGIDPNANNVAVSYKFINCPSTFLSGNVKSCLMEGASNSYIPMQFFNSKKIIKSVKINGIDAQQNKDSFFYYASPQQGKETGNQWFKNVEVTLTSNDDETQTGTFAFGGSSGCATTSFQFAAASTADGADDDESGGGGGSGDGSGSGILLPAILGGVGALILIVASIFFVRRRRAAKDNDEHPDVENGQYLSPPSKQAPERPTYGVDNSIHNSTDDPSDNEPNSPTVFFDDAATPAAAEVGRPFGGGAAAAMSIQQQQQRQPAPQHIPEQQQSKPAYYSYTAPSQQTYSYSKPVVNERAANAEKLRGSTRAGPTFPAPVLPAGHFDEDDDEEDRSSFDIDDMRKTEEIKENERNSLFNERQAVAPYSSESAYSTAPVTSPQSYVRATALRRNSSKIERQPLRFTASMAPSLSDSFASEPSDRDSYASDAARGTTTSATGSFRDTTSSKNTSSTGGYSQESLGILGYPYARKPSGRNSSSSITEMQL